jgi:hypothetical protein
MTICWASRRPEEVLRTRRAYAKLVWRAADGKQSDSFALRLSLPA